MTDVKSPVTGAVWKILVEAGQDVEEGDELAILESMKMEFPIEAPQGGKVAKIVVDVGAQVAEGDLLMTIA